MFICNFLVPIDVLVIILFENICLTCFIFCRSENIDGGLQIPQSAVTSYFKEQSSGKWGLQIPGDNTACESHRWPIGFVTTGFVRGRLVYMHPAT